MLRTDKRTDGRTDGQTDGQAQTNMPPQLLRSWGHKNSSNIYFHIFSILKYKTKNNKGSIMDNWHPADHFTEGHIHSGITCNIEEPQQKYHLGTVSNRLLGVGGRLSMFNWIQTSPSASAMVQPNQTITINSTDQHKIINIHFYIFSFF